MFSIKKKKRATAKLEAALTEAAETRQELETLREKVWVVHSTRFRRNAAPRSLAKS